MNRRQNTAFAESQIEGFLRACFSFGFFFSSLHFFAKNDFKTDRLKSRVVAAAEVPSKPTAAATEEHKEEENKAEKPSEQPKEQQQ